MTQSTRARLIQAGIERLCSLCVSQIERLALDRPKRSAGAPAPSGSHLLVISSACLCSPYTDQAGWRIGEVCYRP